MKKIAIILFLSVVYSNACMCSPQLQKIKSKYKSDVIDDYEKLAKSIKEAKKEIASLNKSITSQNDESAKEIVSLMKEVSSLSLMTDELSKKIKQLKIKK